MDVVKDHMNRSDLLQEEHGLKERQIVDTIKWTPSYFFNRHQTSNRMDVANFKLPVPELMRGTITGGVYAIFERAKLTTLL